MLANSRRPGVISRLMGGKTKLSPAEYHRLYRARKAAQRAAGVTPPPRAAKQSTPQSTPQSQTITTPTAQAPQSKATQATQPQPPPPPTALDDSAAALWLDDPPPSNASAAPTAATEPSGQPLARSSLVTTAPHSIEAIQQGGNVAGVQEQSISKRSQEAGIQGEPEEAVKAGESEEGERGEKRRKAAAKRETTKQGETAEREGFSGDTLSALCTREAADILGHEKQNVLRSPTPDFKPGKFAAPPCSLEVFDRVCYRMMRGDFWRDISKDENGILWENVRACAGQSADLSARWVAVDNARRAAFAADIEETGQVLLATARAELPAVDETGDTPHGPTSRRSFQRAASTAQAGAALLQPATHGKLAAQRDAPGSGGGSIIVNIAVAPGILPPGAPPVIVLQRPNEVPAA